MSKFNEAIKFASDRHDGQKRKIINSPYIFHPMEVAQIVFTMTSDEDTLCAAVLHDTVEDTNTTIEEIQEKFGDRVKELVSMETENKRKEQKASDTWHLRKEEQIEHLKHCTDINVKMICLGDKLSNLRSLHRSYTLLKDDLWFAFNEKKASSHAWYYKSMMEAFSELKDTDAYLEYERLYNDIFKEVNIDGK